MSRYRANITWQSPDGTWSTGFYAFDEDYLDILEERGVDLGADIWDEEAYDLTAFEAVYTGHPAEDAALEVACWEHGNAGTYEVLRLASFPGRSAYDAQVAELDGMAAACPGAVPAHRSATPAQIRRRRAGR